MINLIPIDNPQDHYYICRSWLEDKDITKWLSSVLRFAKYHRIIHQMLIQNRKNKLFFISFDDRVVGIVGLSNLDLVDKRAEVWYLIGSRSDRSNNFATQTLGLTKNFAVENLKLVTLYAHVAESNSASTRVLKKNDFEYVGKFRKAFLINGSYEDMLIFDWVCN